MTNYYYEGYHTYLNRHLHQCHSNRNLSGSQAWNYYCTYHVSLAYLWRWVSFRVTERVYYHTKYAGQKHVDGLCTWSSRVTSGLPKPTTKHGKMTTWAAPKQISISMNENYKAIVVMTITICFLFVFWSILWRSTIPNPSTDSNKKPYAGWRDSNCGISTVRSTIDCCQCGIGILNVGGSGWALSLLCSSLYGQFKYCRCHI